MLVQSVMKTSESIQTDYANPIRSATVLRQGQIVDVITLAFSSDPVARWVYPNSQQYLQYFGNFVRLFGGKAFEMGGAVHVKDFAAAALWLPPNVAADEDAIVSLFKNTVHCNLQEELFYLFEEMGKYHPAEPHWYLPMIGTDPVQQGKGYGSALLKYTLAIVERDGKSAYLESTNPRNIPLYQRFGFEIIGKIQVGSSPPIFPMLRQPVSNFETQFYQNN